jgi:DNA replication and repair protein RecF
MTLARVRLVNFRNYEQAQVHLQQGLTLVCGGNGQGKTNLLEAVSLACTGKEIRAASDSEMIRFGQTHAIVTVELTSLLRGAMRFQVSLGPEGSEIEVNGVKRRAADLIGLVGLVLFSVEDVDIVKGEPSDRRSLLDSAIGGLSRSYHWNLLRYRKVLSQRNHLLKEIREGRARERDLEAWDEPLATLGTAVMQRRIKFLSDLAGPAEQAHRNLSGRDLALVYEPGLPGTGTREDVSKDSLVAALAKSRGEEISRGMSLLGPHRDDFRVLSAGTDLRTFGSQGEQRTAAIALRLGTIAVVQERLEEPPLVLLDDVFSELDQARREGLLEATRRLPQVIVTCTEAGSLAGRAASILRVENGDISPVPAVAT